MASGEVENKFAYGASSFTGAKLFARAFTL